MLTVIKVGGGAGIDPLSIIPDIVTLIQQGEQVVVVHGCSAATNELAERLGEPVQHVTSRTGVRSRYTNATMLEIFTMATVSVLSTMTIPDE